ncbi:hypothetical protein ACUOA5_45440, partial [Escherichia coli]
KWFEQSVIPGHAAFSALIRSRELPDKAFTPHPAIGARCLMRRLRVLSCLQPLPNVGRIRHLRRIRQSVHDA